MFKNTNTYIVGLVLGALALVACATPQHVAQVPEKRLTVGSVQAHIKPGLSGAKVMEALGSPNIVSTDDQGLEVWTYDKISSSHVQRSSSAGGFFFLVGGGSSTASQESSQRTLTVIIYFDAQKKVRNVSYHSTRF